MMRIILAISVLGMVVFGCKKSEVNTDITQAVLFEYEYVNHAWIYTHMGWMIDENGEVKGFTSPGNWKFTDDEGYISKEDLESNLSQTDTCYFAISKDDILNHFNERFDLLNGRIDTSDTFMADAGIGGLYVYVWNQQMNKYKKQVLATSGDISVTNSHHKAGTIISWLKGIGERTDRYYWIR